MDPKKPTLSDDETMHKNPAYKSEADAPAEGARDHNSYHDANREGESAQQEAELTTGDEPAEGKRDSATVLEEVRDVPQGATEEMTVRSDEAGDMPDAKVNAMNLPNDALPSEIAPVGGNPDKQGDFATQDNTGGHWNVDPIAPAPPETEDLQEAFNPTSNPDDQRGEVF